MIRAVLPLLACVAGCGRVGFGEVSPDAEVPIGHDEDADGIGDATDKCPHLAGSNLDSDGDGVGDACDPNPSTPGDRISVFSPLTPGTSPFEDISLFGEEADGLRHTGDQHLRIFSPATNTRIEIGFDLYATIGTGQHQIAVGAEGSAPYYFAELNENMSPTALQIVSYDQVNGYINLDSVSVASFHPGRGIMRLDASTTNRKFVTLAGWEGELYVSSAATPGFDGGVSFRFSLNGVDMRINYIILIDSP